MKTLIFPFAWSLVLASVLAFASVLSLNITTSGGSTNGSVPLVR
ncbi:hypothetical protein [Stutzerimonas nosocomialis]|nr:hypothetical protein [Stutzerimonas nosocomialis]